MNRRPIVGVIALAVILGAVALRTQRNARRTMEQERNYVQILERTSEGHAEYYTGVIPLVEAFTKPGERINWFAAAYADPSKPEFALVFSNVSEPRDEWEVDAKKPIAMIADGRPHKMKPHQALLGDDGKDVVMVSVGGPRSILAAVVAPTKAEIEFGGKQYDIDVRGLRTAGNC